MESATIYNIVSVSGAVTSELVLVGLMMQLATNLIGAGDDCWELVFLFFVAFYHGLEDGWVVGSQVDEDMADAALWDLQGLALFDFHEPVKKLRMNGG
jgi:hypothetical protein